MATNERRADPKLAAIKQTSANRLVSKLKAAHRAGTLRPINPNVQPVTKAVRIKVV